MDGEGASGAELVERLSGIGVEPREAQLFVHLVLHGPSRASDAAAATRLKRTETYRALEALMKRGFVTAHLTRPVVYEAVAAEALFAELLADHEQRRDEIARLRESLVAAVRASQRDRASASGRHGYKIIQGRRAILTALESSLRHARASVCTVSTYLGSQPPPAQSRAFQTLLRRAAEGVHVRALLRDGPAMERTIEPLLAYSNVEIRFFDAPDPIRFAIVDGKEIAYWLVSDPDTSIEAREDVAMWTNAPDFVRAQQTLFDALWAAGRIARRVQVRS